jgi:outer membrane immunogenic protein
MKRILPVCASLAFPFAALAADLPMRTAAPPPVFVTAPTWTGFYFGGHLGYGWGSFDVNGNKRRNTLDNNGVVAGVQAGYNYQSGMWVFGLEGDLSAAPWKETTSNGPAYEFRTRWMGSFRSRVGLVFKDFLIYGTAGVGAVDRTAFANFSKTDFYKIGAVAGGGFEYKLTQNIVAGVDGLYFFVKDKKGYSDQNVSRSNANDIGRRAGNVGVVRARLSFLW